MCPRTIVLYCSHFCRAWFWNGQLAFSRVKASCNDLTAFSQSVLSTTKARLSSEDPCAIIITLILSFETDEKTLAANSSSTVSGSYQITQACSINAPLVCTGQGNLNLNNQGCPPFVVSNAIGQTITGCASPVNPRCTLNYLFEIEVVGNEYN